jgi:outer membrane protein OmpA-like peptidoglycan-associated protein
VTRLRAWTLGFAALVLCPAPAGRADEPGDVLVVTSILDFAVEGLPETATLGTPLAFHLVLPQKGIVRAQAETRIVTADGRAAFLETWLYDATTVGNRHLVYVEPQQLPGTGDYAIEVRVAGMRRDERGGTIPFALERRYSVRLVAGEREGPERSVAERLAVRVLFAYDSYEVRPSEQPQIEAAAERFRALGPAALLIVEGHTDTAGGAAYNLDLSSKRAAAVKKRLVAAGVPAARIRTYGYGFERLADPRRGDAPPNRRVEFVLHPGEAP